MIDRTMLTDVAEVYANLTPKARAILHVLMRSHQSFGDSALTRRQIAQALGQYRLYPHDDRAIKQLEAVGFVLFDVLMLGDGEFPPDIYGRPARRDITRYTRYHVHWLNPRVYPLLKAIRNETLRSKDKSQPQPIGAVQRSSGVLQALKDLLRGR